jgi:hypothetical protein
MTDPSRFDSAGSDLDLVCLERIYVNAMTIEQCLETRRGVCMKSNGRGWILGTISVVSMLDVRSARAADYEMITIEPTLVKTLTAQVNGPEGPSVLPDGSLAVVEFITGNILHVNEDGSRDVLATPGVGIVGTALGRDNALYAVKLDPGTLSPPAPPAGEAPLPPLPSSPATVLRIDLKSRQSRILYRAYRGQPLKGPDDLVIDKWGDLWFTDTAEGSVYWARTDGSQLRREITDLKGVNGITLSPDKRIVYVTGNGELLAYDIVGRGQLKVGAWSTHSSQAGNAHCGEGGGRHEDRGKWRYPSSVLG